MAGRPGLPGIKCIGAAAATVAANGGLWTLGFKLVTGKFEYKYIQDFNLSC